MRSFIGLSAVKGFGYVGAPAIAFGVAEPHLYEPLSPISNTLVPSMYQRIDRPSHSMTCEPADASAIGLCLLIIVQVQRAPLEQLELLE